MLTQYTNKVTFSILKNSVKNCKFTPAYFSDQSEKTSSSPLKGLLEESSSFQDINPASREQQWATLPYPQGTKVKKIDELRKPKLDSKDTSIILFPGQGTQYVGMAKKLLRFPMAVELFELSNYILGYDLLKLCLNGPKSEIDQTKYCQPAVMVCSLAAIEQLKEERPSAIDSCRATAGFSLGEITALVFAGAFEFEQALKLVKLRAEAMQLASETFKGGMLTIFYGADNKVKEAIKKAKEWALDRGDDLPECVIANYLYPDCKVISGSESAIDFLEKNFREFNIRKVKRLPVNGAFHSQLMEPAMLAFRKALNKMEIKEPAISVYSNVDGYQYRNAEHIRRQLPKQIVKPVKWEQFLHIAYARSPEESFPKTYEVGPGSTLKAILKQVNAKAWNDCYSIES